MPQFIVLILVVLFPSLSIAASFDCKNPGNHLTKMICGNAQLSKSDGELRATYLKALKESRNASLIKRRQHEWQVNVRDRCNDVTCLKKAYSSRVAQLSAEINSKTQEENQSFKTAADYVLADAKALTPLNLQELNAVNQEITAIAKTQVWLSESSVLEDSFIVHEATPSRIDRLLRMPEFIQQPAWNREVALIFAGQGAALTFDKPTDILAKVSEWFPEEISAARSDKKRPFFAYIDLRGPYPNWQDEPAAFITLWRCMPQKAWLMPTQSIFKRRWNDGGNTFMAIGDRHSGQFNFGECVHERNNSVITFVEEEYPVIEKERREIGSRVAPVLQRKFARFLSSNRCKGTGPEDCVLLLLLWSSLSPDDAELAKAIQTLEPDISPDSPLPALQKPIEQYETDKGVGEPRFDEGLRKAAFMRAKLLSVLNAENSWGQQALAATLHQISGLQKMLADAKSFRGYLYIYDIDQNNEEVSPWYGFSLAAGKTPRVQTAVMAELDSLTKEGKHNVLEAWFKNGGKNLRLSFELRQLAIKPVMNLDSTDWELLRQGQSEEERNLRSKYLALLGHDESGEMHEMLLSQLTSGKICFDGQDENPQDWQGAICKKWIAEPQTVPFTLPHSHLTLNQAKQFHPTPLLLPAASATEPPDIASLLNKLVQGMSEDAQKKMQAFIADLKRREGSVHAATWWSHPDHDKSLVELQLYINDQPTDFKSPFTGSRILLVFDAQTLSFVRVPFRFLGGYDHNEIVHVSDLDEDGNLEVWWAESFRKCHGDETDVEREIDCSAKRAEMGEVWGDSLTYFSNTPRTSKQANLNKAKLPDFILAAAPSSAVVQSRFDDKPCNTALVAQTLKKQVPINFGGGEHGDRGDVISLVCKPHPQHPEQTIVALFHDLSDKPVNSEQKGFMMAVIDAKKKKIHSLYRDTLEEDASTRIDSYSLEIDTARYNLAPGVRAFGVRMHIGYSPRCAEGGESNYLTLFIEEGKQLKPIIKNFAMSSWSITEGSNNCGYGEDASYTMDNVERTLAVAPTTTQGWHDLELVAHHLIEASVTASDNPVNKKKTEQVLGKFRANNKTLWLDTKPPAP